ncbi:MAG: M3 family oligoendopeptidase [Clostridiales bacterium]|nr:M3 family oligoendopeptidase [Clostridiales bacterium]MDO4350847.1 M3 family oligoendopeptidase [Eubacteriales bacterium]MDY4008146.1 M3 family oligoendopeptidase [Candidatus Limiplasma sp.]
MNDMTWDLSVFYSGFDDPALRGDLEKIREQLGQTEALLNAGVNDVQKLESIVAAEERLQNLLNRTYGYVELTLAADTENADALRCLDELSNLMVDVRLAHSQFVRYIGGVEDLDAKIRQSETLAQNAFILKEAAQEAGHMLPASMEKWMLRMSLNGGDAFSKMRDRLMGSHTVELDGKTLPLPAVRGMAYDPDPAVRKAAYEAELASYKKVETPMAYCLSCIKGEAQTLSELKGYPDILTQQLVESRMDQETLDAMWTAIREALPDFRRYLKRKAELLGHQNGLPFYDLFAPMGESTKKYTVDEAHALLVDVFTRVNPEMGRFIDHAFNNRWIDMFPREGKEGGAFCAGFHDMKISRVLTNFVGSFSDVSTLAHELGHGWHNHCLERKPLLMADPPMPLAETASIFNETMLSHEVRKTADEKTRFALLENSLMETTQVIVDIYSRFLFESAVIEARKTHIPTPAELNQMMLDAQEQSYGDGLDPEARHSGMWINKSHYYSTGRHFYNFPYAFGHLFGLGVFQKYLAEGPAFMPKYDELLASCGSGPIAEVAASVGIDVRSVDYWRSALDVARAEVDEFIRLSQKQ